MGHMTKPLPSIARLAEAFRLDPASGTLYNNISRGTAKAGSLAGTLNPSGYWIVQLDGENWRVHRVIFALANGRDAAGPIDHINTNKADNRPCNLREATKSENQWNRSISARNTSGRKGVSWDRQVKKWRADISPSRKHRCLGHFDEIEDAALAYRLAAEQEHGEFART